MAYVSDNLARDLVMSYGWNATACQILNPGIDHWFSPKLPAVVGYTRRDSVMLAAGAPVCPPEVLADVCAEFEAHARKRHCRVCYVCAEDRLRTALGGSGDHSMVALGAQPVWDPRMWDEIIRSRSSLRAQLNRSRNKAVVVEPLPAREAVSNLEIRRVLGAWLKARTLPPLHFLVEPDVLDGVVDDRVIFVATREGSVVGFLVASPVVAKNGYLVELLARSHEAPNGTSELLIDAAMRRFGREDRGYVTLGLVALAGAAQTDIDRNPWWLQAMMKFARLHANRFYNFRGLEHFRLKMAPSRWETLYAISNERSFSVQTLYNMGRAFSGISPMLAIGIAAVKALRQEFQLLTKTASSLVGQSPRATR